MVDKNSAVVASGPPAAPERDTPFGAARGVVLGEINMVAGRVREREAVGLQEEILRADRVFLLGMGRSKLVADAFAMRLVHLGLNAHVAADMTTPSTGKGDLLVACSGSGETPVVVTLTDEAVSAGTRVAVVTAEPRSRLGQRAHHLVRLDCGGGDTDSEQFVGTLFEQACLVFFDCLVLVLEQTLGVASEEMFARHTNLE
ncbi:6-phospho-3-hexuloisomerase [Actinopolyspora biskrensis]|uniref:6-phospho-3-hexuloisomerase n=1 Tax=Actinopolyspora biskrensis TaxID=1470178 RepID=A0A852YSI2_9ACTN|nr:6-phospho-3-hexuloisomerase [Actinopolyspora biskrensis]NYH77671.1 6-phospho-3-hexuloisomerase [Actinopolyspora biskrensis]